MNSAIQTHMSRLFLLGVLLSFAVGLNYLNAWTAPLQAPPAGNVPAPLNTGATLQGKSGGLTIGSTLDIGSSLTVGGVPSDGPYLVDMGAATPGAFKGIRFPDDTVQTTASIFSTKDTDAIAPGTTKTITVTPTATMISLTGTYVGLSGFGLEAVPIGGYITKDLSGTWKAVIAMGSQNNSFSTITSTESCSTLSASFPASGGTGLVCVSLIGGNITIRTGTVTHIVYSAI